MRRRCRPIATVPAASAISPIVASVPAEVPVRGSAPDGAEVLAGPDGLEGPIDPGLP